MTSTPAEVAALLKIAAMEPETLDDLGRVSLPCRGFSGRVRSRESDAGVDR